jgi:hypothetical protein
LPEHREADWNLSANNPRNNSGNKIAINPEVNQSPL